MAKLLIISLLILGFGYSQNSITLEQLQQAIRESEYRLKAEMAEIRGDIKEIKGDIRALDGKIEGLKGEVSTIKWGMGIFVLIIFAILSLPFFNRLLEKKDRREDSYLDETKIRTIVKNVLKEERSKSTEKLI